MLEYVPGVVPWSEKHYEYLGTDEAMRRAGRLLREFHDAVRSFSVPDDAVWCEPDRARDADSFVDERGVIICHNDPTAWNLVVGPERWVFIDWDFAGPRPFIWDVAYALVGLIPIAADARGLGWAETVPIGPRLRAVADGYGLSDADRGRLVDALVARIRSSYDHLRRAAQAGTEPWRTLWAEGHGEGWADMLRFSQSHRASWTRELVG